MSDLRYTENSNSSPILRGSAHYVILSGCVIPNPPITTLNHDMQAIINPTMNHLIRIKPLIIIHPKHIEYENPSILMQVVDGNLI